MTVKIVSIVINDLPDDTGSCPRRIESSATLLWESKMSHFAHVIRIIKTVMMGWAGHVFRVEVTNVYSANIVAKKLKERDHFKYMSMIALKQILMK